MTDLSYFDKKIILVTGGSGSVGSQLVSALLNTNCKTIRILSNNEHELYLLQNKYPNEKKLRFLLGDIRDKERLFVATEDVDIVFHAAALKHVPLCEYNPFDAVQTNVVGTQNIIEACKHSNVKKFVFISTDKAASPQSTLGATKLLAERLTISSLSYRTSLEYIAYCVRFGNVLDSRGSVVDLFYNQIKQKKPITITDKKMTRFTMTPQEAVNLILSTVELAKGGEVFVLKMKVMRIIDLVQAMIELYGKNGKIEITEIGKRQGEKLHEELISDAEISRTKEFENMYVIPSFDSSFYDKFSTLKSPYTSDSAEPMTVKEIKSLLQIIRPN